MAAQDEAAAPPKRAVSTFATMLTLTELFDDDLDNMVSALNEIAFKSNRQKLPILAN